MTWLGLAWCRLAHFASWIDLTGGMPQDRRFGEAAAQTVLACRRCRREHRVTILWALRQSGVVRRAAPDVRV